MASQRTEKQAHRQPNEPPQGTGKRAAFIAITISVPVVFLILLEAALRLAHYGPNLSLLTTETIGGRVYHIMNPSVKDRYFSHVRFNPSPSPDYFLVPKPKGTYRIFCLGGSTTVGYPYWFNGSFAAFLRDRVRAVFPGRQIEVINMGMTATNSFTVLDFARELVNYEPDLFVVYDGHNEFYGALGVSSRESLGHSRWLAELNLSLLRFRTFVLLRDIYQWAAGLFQKPTDTRQGGTMMERLARGEYIRYRSEEYQDALSIFNENLDSFTELARQHNVPVLLSSQVSNLRDQAPFVSEPDPRITQDDRQAWEQSFERGQQEWNRGDITAALSGFRTAALHDSMRADIHYAIGQCLDSLHDPRQALAEYVRARDLDELRFRASSDFNDAIRHHEDGKGVWFVDMEQMFKANSPDSIIGNSLIEEHLHPNSRGYFLMGKAYTQVMRQHGLLEPADAWDTHDTVSDERLWRERNLTELDERIADRTREVLISGWPFKAQFPTVTAVAGTDTLGQIAEKAVRAVWSWAQAHETAAEYYARRGELDNVEKEYQVVISQIPLDAMPYLELAGVYIDEGRVTEARAMLLASTTVNATALAYRTLGDMALRAGRPLEAIPYYEKLDSFNESPSAQADNGYVTALAYLRANMPERSVERLEKVLTIKSDFQPARELLSTIRRIQSQARRTPQGNDSVRSR